MTSKDKMVFMLKYAMQPGVSDKDIMVLLLKQAMYTPQIGMEKPSGFRGFVKSVKSPSLLKQVAKKAPKISRYGSKLPVSVTRAAGKKGSTISSILDKIPVVGRISNLIKRHPNLTGIAIAYGGGSVIGRNKAQEELAKRYPEMVKNITEEARQRMLEGYSQLIQPSVLGGGGGGRGGGDYYSGGGGLTTGGYVKQKPWWMSSDPRLYDPSRRVNRDPWELYKKYGLTT